MALPTPRKLTSLELSPRSRAALKRIKKIHGLTLTAAVERGVALLEAALAEGAQGKAAK